MARRAQTFTVSGASVLGLLASSRAVGVELSGALHEVGLAGVDLARPECRVELPALDALWDRAAAASGDEDFGLHVAERLDLDAFHVVGHLARTSRTLGEAIERVVAFSRLLHDAGRTELERTRDGRFLLFPGCRGLPVRPARHLAEFNAASVVVLARFITGLPGWHPLEVALEHPAPERLTTHRRVFGVTPTFKATEACLTLDAAAMALPVRESAPSQLGQYLEGYARGLLQQLPEPGDDLRGQVLRGVVTALAGGEVSIEAQASRLAMTPRTLQRRLKAAGTSFAELVDEARLRTAERFLADGALPLAEVSFLLGFKDPSTFHKAFRRWTGKTPGAWREQLQADAGG